MVAEGEGQRLVQLLELLVVLVVVVWAGSLLAHLVVLETLHQHPHLKVLLVVLVINQVLITAVAVVVLVVLVRFMVAGVLGQLIQ